MSRKSPAKRKSNRRQGWLKSKLARLLLVVFLLFVLLILLGSSAVYFVLLQELPSIAALKDFRPSIATRVYDVHDELIDEFFLEDRKLVKISEIPPYAVQAFVAAEDARFFQHKGLDLQSITRAFYKNLEAGKIVQGGSTITQQVAKSLYLSPERKFIRKIREAVLAYKIDRYLTKEEILNLYLNYIYLGHGTYGIEAAAQGYFGKSARYLNLSEASMLAALPKAPNAYSPFLHYDKARARQDYVLTRMAEDGYITPAQREDALRTPMQLRSFRPKEKIAPYFVEHVRRYVQGKYGSDVLYKEGLEIYTTLDIAMQKSANEAVERGLAELEGRSRASREAVQGALLCMDVKTGAIRAMVGGRDFGRSEFNRATQAYRQPGSAFKPLIYTAAFDKGLTPATTLIDAPISFEDRSQDDGFWKPRNFDGKFLGPVTLRTALVQSRNVVTVKLLQEIGVNYAVAYATNMGITSPLVKNLSLSLGSSGVTLQEMVRAYGVLANGGKRVAPYFIRKIVDRTGQVFEESQIVEEQVIDPRIAFLTTYVLQDVVESGTGRRVRSIGRPVAAKTGTTNDNRDAWFIGFSPSLVTGVWVGYDQEQTLGREEVGGRAAAPIWLYYMEKALQSYPVEVFPAPEGIVFVRIDPETGYAAGPMTKGAIFEAFLDGTIPDSAVYMNPDLLPEGIYRSNGGGLY